MSYIMVISKRMTSIINMFSLQSFFLFLSTFLIAMELSSVELYVVSALILILKVILIPWFLHDIVKKVHADSNLGFYINPILSLFIAILLTYLAYFFTLRIMPADNHFDTIAFIVSLSVILIGLFIMVFRIKALTQVIGLLIMENGLFLAAVAMCGSMPFFVEIALFFDIFMFVIIIGIFVYRINELFTHIDVDKLNNLRG